MSDPRALLSWLLLTAALATATPGQDDRPRPTRVALIGASVTAGFEDGPAFGAKTQGDSVGLVRLLRPWLREASVRVSSAPFPLMLALFQDPEANGGKQVDLVLRGKPDVLLALDFPFWFGYGHVGSTDEAAARLRLQQKGLELLAKFDCPIIVGDYADMTGAARRMLSPRQIPDAVALQQLNEGLRAWAKERGNVQVFPLSSWLGEIKSEKGTVLPLAAGPVRATADVLLQEDRLHATRLGMALLVYRLQKLLRAALPKDHPLQEVDWTLERFVETAGAEDALEALAEGAGAGKE